MYKDFGYFFFDKVNFLDVILLFGVIFSLNILGLLIEDIFFILFNIIILLLFINLSYF